MGQRLSSDRLPPETAIFLIFDYVGDFDERSRLLVLNKYLSSLLTTNSAYRRYLMRLHIEKGVYSNPGRGPGCREAFLRLLRKQDLWENVGDAESPEVDEDVLPLWRQKPRPSTTENFHIAVSARFKPKDASDEETDTDSKVTLPLHQRIQLIKMSKRLKKTSEVLKVLKSEGAWFGDKWSAIESQDDGTNKENNNNTGAKTPNQEHLVSGVHEIDPMNNRVVMVDPTKGLREFTFDTVVSPKVSQSTVYDESARPLIADFINGFNATILVYGQTGSGKTYTMFGPSGSGNNGDRGIVPRSCAEVLTALDFRRDHLKIPINARLTVSYVEIYGNDVTDLLQDGAPCGHSKVAAQEYVLSGAASHQIHTMEDVLECLKMGDECKRRASTAMNERSSRAHSLFILELNQQNVDSGVSCKSRLFLADLGGCEQIKKSKVNVGKSNHLQVLKEETMGAAGDFLKDESKGREEDADVRQPRSSDVEAASSPSPFSTGFQQSDRLREAVYINLGLLALKQCVKNLNDPETNYVPYSDSKLTLLLSSGLGGDSKSSVIVCAAQESKHSAETTSALLFGQACRKITKTARTGANMLAELIDKIDSQIKETEAQIKAKERWEVIEEKRKDTLAEEGTMEALGFGGVEVKKITVLVGAEEERERLNKLLKERAQLTGTTLESEIGGDKYGGAVGFGKSYAAAYGLGKSVNDTEEVYRFKDEVDKDAVPDVLKKKGKVGGWKGMDQAHDQKTLEKMAKTVNRRRLAYAGVSA